MALRTCGARTLTKLRSYYGLSREYFYFYLKEMEFRFNHRKAANLATLVKKIVKKHQAVLDYLLKLRLATPRLAPTSNSSEDEITRQLLKNLRAASRSGLINSISAES